MILFCFSMVLFSVKAVRPVPEKWLPACAGSHCYYIRCLLLLGCASLGLAHVARHLQAGLVGGDGNQLIIGVLLDDLDHVRIGIAAMAVANFGHLAQQVFVVLAGDHRIELFLVAFAVLAVAFQTFLFVQRLAFGDTLLSIGRYLPVLAGIARLGIVMTVIKRNAQAFDVGGNVGQFLGIGQRGGKRVHRRVVAQTGTDVGHLLDQHSGVLAGELREGAVGATGAGGQVAGAAGLVTLFATLLVTLLGQCFDFFTRLGVPLVILAFDPLGFGGRGGSKSDACAEQADQQKRCFHVWIPFGSEWRNDEGIVHLPISAFLDVCHRPGCPGFSMLFELGEMLGQRLVFLVVD